jgi:excinuclease ABC subunit A
MKQIPCETCNGYRLKPESLKYLIHGKNIGQLCSLTAEEAIVWFSENAFAPGSETLIKEIQERLHSIVRTGIGYIAIQRITSTLSGGEFQRLRLSGLLKTLLRGILYVLDEPSFGLSRSDVARMTSVIKELKSAGNTVLISDHSEEILNISDHAIEMGPSAGAAGGEIVFSGEPGLLAKKISLIQSNMKFSSENQPVLIDVKGAYANNLKYISAIYKEKTLTVITGNSGSGKTSLLQQVVYASIQSGQPVFCKEFSSKQSKNDTIFIGQEVASGSSLSVPATWLGLFDMIRKLFAGSEDAKKNGLGVAHFSFHTREGQCPDCKGNGVYKTAMDFWNDSEVLCESCHGQRYAPQSLTVHVSGLTIAGVLALSFDEAITWISPLLKGKELAFAENVISLVQQTGLGYICLGQPLNTLSSGEMQRMKLVLGMSQKKNNCLYLLDEPTGGLHPSDTLQLLHLFNSLIKDGNTIICATHDEMLMQAASDIIRL